MSLVSLSSESSTQVTLAVQPPNNFKNFFPQPLLLKPHSQVALITMSFDGFVGNEYTIVGSLLPNNLNGNNKLLFGFADAYFQGDYDVAVLRPSTYTGNQLATEIARAMNEANRLRHWTFACAFTKGNEQANPITFNAFAISYTASAHVPPFSQGNWLEASAELVSRGNAVVSNLANMNTTFPQTATRVAIIEDPTGANNDYQDHAVALSWQRGLAQYVSTDGHGGGSVQFMIHADGPALLYEDAPQVADVQIGVMRPTFAGKSLEGMRAVADPEMSFNGSADIKVYTHYNVGNQQNGLIIIGNTRVNLNGEPMHTNSTPSILRIVNLTGILTTKQDVLLVRITPFYPTMDYVVQLLKSTDRGETFAVIPDGTGGANSTTDTGQKIYTTTLDANFSAFESVVYSTNVAFTGGTNDTPILFNMYEPATQTLIPFVNIDRTNTYLQKQDIITGLTLGSDRTDAPVSAMLDEDGATRTATSKYAIQFNTDNTNGYDGTISISTAPTGADNSNVPSTEIVNRAFKQNTGIRGFTTWFLYADNSVAQAGATAIGSIVLNPTNDKFTITSTSFTSGATWVGTIEGGANGRPSTVRTPYFVDTQMMENDADSVLYRFRNSLPMGAFSDFSSVGGNPDGNGDPTTAPTQAGSLATVGVGQVITNTSRFITGTVSQEDVDIVGEGADRRLEHSRERIGTVQQILGFDETSYENNAGTTTLNTDARPKLGLPSGQRQIHVSIPELSNVKSLEGESDQRYKTIKVLPKTIFEPADAVDDPTVSYDANYEDYIDINNENEIHLNELTMQLRIPNGELSEFVRGPVRATVKFRQDPERHRQMMLDNAIARISAQKDPQAELMITDFVGS
jgi:hypothetical protein